MRTNEGSRRRRARWTVWLCWAVVGAGCAHRLAPQAVQMNSRGAALLARGELESAEASFRLALEYGDRFAEPHNNLGLIALSRGRVREARAHFRAALERNPDFAEAWSNLGLALAARATPRGVEDLEGAPAAVRNAYREALEANPGFVDARVNLTRWLLERREATEALEQARRLTQVAPALATAHALRAEAALAVGGYEEAQAECEEGARVSRTERDDDVRLSCARVALARGEVAVAREALDALLEAPRVGPQARALRAVLFVAVGDRPGALRMLASLSGEMQRSPAARIARAQLGLEEPPGEGEGAR